MNIRLYGVFIVILVLVGISACSSSSSKLLEGKDTALFTDSIKLVDVALPEHRNPDGAMQIDVNCEEDRLEVVLTAATDFKTESLTYHLEFDTQLACESAQLSSLLGSPEERFDFIKSDFPGVVGIGQTTMNNRVGEIAKGDEFARVVLSTTRLISASESNSNPTAAKGVALRCRSLESPTYPDSYDFVNQDVVFDYWQTENELSELTIKWEEANDADYNNDGVVTASDLTPIGALYGEHISYDDDYGFTGNPLDHDFELQLSRNERCAQLYNISATSAEQINHGPVTRHSSSLGAGISLVDVYTSQPVLYPVTVASITPMGQYFGNMVGGYEVYLIERGSAGIVDDQKLGEVRRPDVANENFDETLAQLNYDNDAYSTTYRMFVRNPWGSDPTDQTGYRSNAGIGEEAVYIPGSDDPGPLKQERPVYQYKRDLLRDFPSEMQNEVNLFMQYAKADTGTEVFVALVPLQMNIPSPTDISVNQTVRSISDWESTEFTYLADKPLDLSFVDDISDYVPVYLGNEGIISASLDNDPYGYKFTVIFNEATYPPEMDPSEYAEFDIRYMIYYSFDSGTPAILYDANESESGVPKLWYYPSKNYDSKTEVHNIEYSQSGYTIDVPPPASTDDLYLGVRAYFVCDDINCKTEKNTATAAHIIFTDTYPDIEPPGNIYLHYSGYSSVVKEHFKRWITPTGMQEIQEWVEDYDDEGNLIGGHLESSGEYKCIPAEVPHALDASKYGAANLIGIDVSKNDIEDYNSADPPMRSPDEDLEIRLEVFRTQAVSNRDDLENYTEGNMTLPHGPVRFYHDRLDSDLFAVSLGWPYADANSGSGTSTYPMYTPWPTFESDDVPEWAVWAGSPASATFVVANESPLTHQYLTMCSPLHLADNDTVGIIPASWQIKSMNYWPDGGTAVMPSVEYLPSNLPTRYDIDFISFCGNKSMEFTPDPSYRYVVFASVNDKANNSTRAVRVLWLGTVDCSSSHHWVKKSSIKKTLYAMRFGHNFPDHGFRSVSDTTVAEEETQERGFDLAHDPVNNILGRLFVRKDDHRLILIEHDLDTDARTKYSICAASVGNTSLAYDSSGNPHVAYYLTNFDDTGNSGGGVVNPGHGTSSVRDVSDTEYWARVYYRKFNRTNNKWTPKDEVVDSAFLGSYEHTLMVDSSGSPNCLVPVLDQISPVAGFSKSPSWSANAIQGVDDMSFEYLDSIMIGNEIYAGIYEAESSDLKLLRMDSLGVWSTLIADVSSLSVTGHQSLMQVDSNRIGIAYQVDVDGIKKLAYSEYTISPGVISYEQVIDCSDTGYHNDCIIGSNGAPVIITIQKSESGALLAWLDGSEWQTKWLDYTDCSDEHIDFNNIAIQRVVTTNFDRIYCTYMGLGGGSTLQWFDEL